MISFQPTEEQDMICGMVRDFAAKELRLRARDCDEEHNLPADLLAQSLELVDGGGTVDVGSDEQGLLPLPHYSETRSKGQARQ